MRMPWSLNRVRSLRKLGFETATVPFEARATYRARSAAERSGSSVAYSFSTSVSELTADGFATAGGRKSVSVSEGAFVGRMHRTWPLCDTTITASVQTL